MKHSASEQCRQPFPEPEKREAEPPWNGDGNHGKVIFNWKDGECVNTKENSISRNWRVSKSCDACRCSIRRQEIIIQRSHGKQGSGLTAGRRAITRKNCYEEVHEMGERH